MRSLVPKLERFDMDKYTITAAVWRDEPEATFVIPISDLAGVAIGTWC